MVLAIERITTWTQINQKTSYKYIIIWNSKSDPLNYP